MGNAFFTGVQRQTFNENLLINPDFTINQRGEASYTLGQEVKYTYDRWKMLYNAAYSNYTVTKVSNGLSLSIDLTNGGNYFPFAQSVENWEGLKGKVVTISIKVSSVSGSFRIGIFDGPTATAGAYFSTDGIRKFTMRVSENAARVMFVLGVTGIQTHSCIIEWVKLEVGANATPFCPPDRAIELMKCKFYYRVFRAGNNYHEYAIGQFVTTTQSYVWLPIQEMRTTPTLIYGSNAASFVMRWGTRLVDGSPSVYLATVTNMSLRSYGKDYIILQTTTRATMGDGELYGVVALRSQNSDSFIAFDAEIY